MIVLLAGTSGTGKSTLAALLAARLGITTLLSTDSIRHMLRSFHSREEAPLLYASTYQVGWVTTCQLLAGQYQRCAACQRSLCSTQIPGIVLSTSILGCMPHLDYQIYWVCSKLCSKCPVACFSDCQVQAGWVVCIWHAMPILQTSRCDHQNALCCHALKIANLCMSSRWPLVISAHTCTPALCRHRLHAAHVVACLASFEVCTIYHKLLPVPVPAGRKACAFHHDRAFGLVHATSQHGSVIKSVQSIHLHPTGRGACAFDTGRRCW